VGTISNRYFSHEIATPVVVIVHFLITLFLLITSRVIFKATFIILAGGNDSTKRNVLIYGAGQSGIITLNTLSQDQKSDINVVGFIDDNKSKVGKSLAGIKIYNADEALNGMIDKKNIKEQLFISSIISIYIFLFSALLLNNIIYS
jgi:FlaA1/EpsC-like NDP-sugar epimerase